MIPRRQCFLSKCCGVGMKFTAYETISSDLILGPLVLGLFSQVDYITNYATDWGWILHQPCFGGRSVFLILGGKYNCHILFRVSFFENRVQKNDSYSFYHNVYNFFSSEILRHLSAFSRYSFYPRIGCRSISAMCHSTDYRLADVAIGRTRTSTTSSSATTGTPWRTNWSGFLEASTMTLLTP